MIAKWISYGSLKSTKETNSNTEFMQNKEREGETDAEVMCHVTKHGGAYDNILQK